MEYELAGVQAASTLETVEHWKANHQEAMKLHDLELVHGVTMQCFQAVLRLDNETLGSALSPKVNELRAHAIATLIELARFLKTQCQSLPIANYDTPICRSTLEHLSRTLDVMARGEVVWRKDDCRAAREALEQGDIEIVG